MRTLGVAVVGAGFIARDHVAALHRLPGVRVTHVVGLDRGRAAEVARLAEGAVAATDRAAVLADPAVDAVVVCTPTDSHAALTLEALRAGRPVLVEKPVALSLADVDEMHRVAAERGLPLMVGQTSRFQPVHQELAAALADGDIGRLRVLKLGWYLGHVWPHGWRAWQHDVARSGGHPVHNGVHPIDLAVWLMGRRPVRVFARALPTWAAAMPVPDGFHVTLRFDDGGLALIELSYGLPRFGDGLRRAVAFGERGTISHSTADEPGLISEVAGAPSPSVEGAMDRQLRHWMATLRGEEAPIVRPEEVRATLAAALGAQRSLEEGCAVELGDD